MPTQLTLDLTKRTRHAWVEDLPPVITVVHAGSIMGLSRSASYRARERGDIPSIAVNGRYKVPTAKFLAMLGLDRL